MVTLAVSVPPVLVAVIVYVAEEFTAVGVPLRTPVEASSAKPAGSDGETDQETTVPPVDVGDVVVIAVPLVNVNEVVLYEMTGAMSLTTIVIVALSLPPVLVAVIVYVAEEFTPVGVPLMAPVEESKERPAGKPGETVHEVIVPPPTVGVSVVMVVPFSRVRELEPYEIVGGTSLTTMVMLAVSVPPVLVAVMV
jgi:hypothetical protein